MPAKVSTSFITWVLAAGLVLRSFIAPGFMLDTSDGLAIVFCEGPAGAYAAAHPGKHHEHHHGKPSDRHKHFTSSCTHWSTSGLLVINTFFDVLSLPAPAILESHYRAPFLLHYSNTLHPNRGPPLAYS